MAGNELAASFNWTDNQFVYLSFSRNDKPIAFTEHEIDLTFKDPRGNGEIEKILLDPQYRPGNTTNADFWVETTITSPVSNKQVSETALCYWNNDKSIAVGMIEDDGGPVCHCGGKRQRLTEDLQVYISRCAHGGVFWLPNCRGCSCRKRATRTHWH
jgi:hypothetical protein